MSDRVILQKGKVGASTLGAYIKVSALVGAWGVVEGTDGKLEADKALKFLNVNETESFGVKEGTLLHHHISEYFRMGGNGSSLYVLNLGESETFESLVASENVRQMISQAKGEIFQVGFDYIPKLEEMVDGLNVEILPAMRAAQGLADWCFETNRPLHCVVAGAAHNSAAAVSLDLRSIENTELPNVSLVIGQDYDFAETLTGKEQKYAAVGTLLGCMAAQPVSFNVGEVQSMSLTNAGRGLWLNAGISSHKKVVEIESQLASFDAKGYIFGEYYSGNVVFNDDHVCTPIKVDAEGNMNVHTIALSRTDNKVFREIYAAYLPKIKSTVPVDPNTGKLSTGMLKYFEGFGNDVFGRMANNQELSGGDTIVDPESNLLYGEKALITMYNWVPMGTIGRIKGTVNIKNSL